MAPARPISTRSRQNAASIFSLCQSSAVKQASTRERKKAVPFTLYIRPEYCADEIGKNRKLMTKNTTNAQRQSWQSICAIFEKFPCPQISHANGYMTKNMSASEKISEFRRKAACSIINPAPNQHMDNTGENRSGCSVLGSVHSSINPKKRHPRKNGIKYRILRNSIPRTK